MLAYGAHMPSWKYSIQGLDPDRTAIASGRDLRISPKAAREICHRIKGDEVDTHKSDNSFSLLRLSQHRGSKHSTRES